MNAAIIIVFQTEFSGKENVSDELGRLCGEVKDIGGACVYCPVPANLVAAIRVLQDNSINYGIHFHRKFMVRDSGATSPETV